MCNSCACDGEVRVSYTGVPGGGLKYANFTLAGDTVQSTTDYWEVELPFPIEIVAVSLAPSSFTGSPAGFNIDLNVNGLLKLNVIQNTPGNVKLWESQLFGGSDPLIYVGEGTVLGVDVNFAGGSTPSAKFVLVIFYREA